MSEHTIESSTTVHEEVAAVQSDGSSSRVSNSNPNPSSHVVANPGLTINTNTDDKVNSIVPLPAPEIELVSMNNVLDESKSQDPLSSSQQLPTISDDGTRPKNGESASNNSILSSPISPTSTSPFLQSPVSTDFSSSHVPMFSPTSVMYSTMASSPIVTGRRSVPHSPSPTGGGLKKIHTTNKDEIESRRARIFAVFLARSPLLQKLAYYVLDWVATLTVLFFLIPGFLLYAICDNVFSEDDCDPTRYTIAILFVALFHSFSFFVIVFASYIMLYELYYHVIKPSHLAKMYFGTVMHYAGWYMLFYTISPRSLFIDELDQSTDVAGRVVMLFYFSVSVLTTCGLGDATPLSWYAKMTVMTEMVIGITYNVGIFAIVMDHFRSVFDDEAHIARPRNMIWTRLLIYVKRHLPNLDRVRKFVIQNLLFTTVIIQSCLLVLLVLVHGDGDLLTDVDNNTLVGIHILCLVFEVIQLLFVIFAFFRLIQTLRASNVRIWFLMQTYLSVTGLFGGIYLSIYVFSGREAFDLRGLNDHLTLPEAFGEFIYYSVVIMTAVGYGDGSPLSAAGRIFSSIEMLLGLFFNSVILGLGVARALNSWKLGIVDLPPLPSEESIEDVVFDETSESDGMMSPRRRKSMLELLQFQQAQLEDLQHHQQMELESLQKELFERHQSQLQQLQIHHEQLQHQLLQVSHSQLSLDFNNMKE